MNDRNGALKAARAYALASTNDQPSSVEALIVLAWAALSEGAMAAADVGDIGEGQELLGLAEAVAFHWFHDLQGGRPISGEEGRARNLIEEIKTRVSMRGVILEGGDVA